MEWQVFPTRSRRPMLEGLVSKSSIDAISGAEREFNEQGDYLFISDSKNGLVEQHLRKEEHCPIEKSSARDRRSISYCHRNRMCLFFIHLHVFCGLDLADLMILGNPDSGRQLITALRRFCLSTAFASGSSIRRGIPGTLLARSRCAINHKIRYQDARYNRPDSGEELFLYNIVFTR
jgi:hypothetical protein